MIDDKTPRVDARGKKDKTNDWNKNRGWVNTEEKTFIGVVEKSGTTYDIQEALHAEGYFRIKSTPMGANLCLLEEIDEGEVSALIKEDKALVSGFLTYILGRRRILIMRGSPS